MRNALTLILVSTLTASIPGRSRPLPVSLCHAGETTYFSCPVAHHHKAISLCGKVPASLQYRFGSSSKVELAFPVNASEGVQRLRYAHYARFQTDRAEVTFGREGVDYAVFDYTEAGRRTAGVHVTTADGTEHGVTCAHPIEGRLDRLGKSLRCDPDSALNGGSCP